MSRACLRCISKKRRCDHERPVCGSCGKLDVACEYPPPQSRRGPVPGLSKRAEWRVQQLENALCYVLGLPGVGAAVAREQSTATLPTAPTSQLDRVARSEWWADHRLDSVADVLEFRELCLGMDPSISGVGSGGTSVDTRVPSSIASSSRRPILPSSSSLDAILLPIPIPQGGYFDIQPDLPGSASPDGDPLANTRPQYYPIPRQGHVVQHVVHVADPWDPRDRSGLHSHAHSEHEHSRPQSRGLDLERLEHLEQFEHLEQQHRHELEQQQQQQQQRQHHDHHPHQPGPNDPDPYYDQRAYAGLPQPPAATGSTSLRNSMGPSLWQLVTAAIPDANEDRTLVEVHEHHPLPSVWGEDELVNGMTSSAAVVLPPPPPPPQVVNDMVGPRLGEVRAREELGAGELDGQAGVKRRMPDFW